MKPKQPKFSLHQAKDNLWLVNLDHQVSDNEWIRFQLLEGAAGLSVIGVQRAVLERAIEHLKAMLVGSKTENDV